MPFLLELEDIDHGVQLAKELDLDFIELNTNFPNCSLEVIKESNLLQVKEDQGIYFTIHLDDSISIADTNPYVRQAYLQTTLEAIDLAKKFEIPTINIHFAKGNIVTLPDGKHYIFDHYKDDFHQGLLEYRRKVEEGSGQEAVKIAIENTDGWADYEREAIDLLLESPVFGLCLDIGHDHATGNKDLEYIQDRHEKLIHMHAHDGWDQTNHQGLGSGEIPLEDRLNFARKEDARVVLETKTIQALQESVQWLEENGWK